jgi:hypothetical protein
VEEISKHVFMVRDSDSPTAATTVYDLAALGNMFRAFAEECKHFAQLEDDFDADEFLACSVYALCKPTPKQQRHNVYRQLAYAARYFDCTELSDFIYTVARETWSY